MIISESLTVPVSSNRPSLMSENRQPTWLTGMPQAARSPRTIPEVSEELFMRKTVERSGVILCEVNGIIPAFPQTSGPSGWYSPSRLMPKYHPRGMIQSSVSGEGRGLGAHQVHSNCERRANRDEKECLLVDGIVFCLNFQNFCGGFLFFLLNLYVTTVVDIPASP